MSRTCPSCGNGVSETAKFCRACGKSLPATAEPAPPTPPPEATPRQTCTECGTELLSDALFCHRCGAEAPPPPPPAHIDCPSCGKELDGTDAFCRYCGSATRSQPIPRAAARVASTPVTGAKATVLEPPPEPAASPPVGHEPPPAAAVEPGPASASSEDARPSEPAPPAGEANDPGDQRPPDELEARDQSDLEHHIAPPPPLVFESGMTGGPSAGDAAPSDQPPAAQEPAADVPIVEESAQPATTTAGTAADNGDQSVGVASHLSTTEIPESDEGAPAFEPGREETSFDQGPAAGDARPAHAEGANASPAMSPQPAQGASHTPAAGPSWPLPPTVHERPRVEPETTAAPQPFEPAKGSAAEDRAKQHVAQAPAGSPSDPVDVVLNPRQSTIQPLKPQAGESPTVTSGAASPTPGQRTCVACRAPVSDTAKFCRSCGAELVDAEATMVLSAVSAILDDEERKRSEPAPAADPDPGESARRCPKCDAAVETWATFCRHCGTPLPAGPQPRADSAASCEVCGAPAAAGSTMCVNCSQAVGT